MKQSSKHLLRLANTYLQQTLRSDVRYWSLENLYVLAGNGLSRFPIFRIMIKGLTSSTFSDEEWDKWLDKNASILGDYPNKRWMWDRNVPNGISCLISNTESINAYITTDRNEPKIISSKSSAFLQGEGNIPQLWLWTGEYTGVPSEPLSKKIAHFDWLVRSISRVTGASFNPTFNADIEAFVIGNMVKLSSIRRWFQYEPKLLGGGADGVAWDIGGRRILKIFSDTVSYNQAVKAVQRIHNNPALGKTEAMIYDIGHLGTFEGRNIYYYVMERMAPVTEISGIKEELKHIITQIVGKIYAERDYWRGIKKKDFEVDAQDIKQKVQEASRKYADDLLKKNNVLIKGIENTYLLNRVKVDKENPDEHIVPLNPKWLQSLVEEVLMKYLTGRGDLHLGNLGVTAYGEFRYFDPAFEDWNSQINMGGGFVPDAEKQNKVWI